MAFKDYLTAEGERMLAKAVNGSNLTFTKMVLGSGYLPAGASEKNVSQVITPEKELTIESVSMNSSNTCCITSYFSNEGLETGFYMREKALYVSDGTEEVLAIYGNAGSTAEYIDTVQTVVIEKKIRTVLALSADEAINVTLSGSAYAPAPIIPAPETTTSLDDFINSPEAVTMEVGQTVIINNVVYTLVADDTSDINNYYSGGEKEEFDDSVTVFSDDYNTITTTYASGAKVVTTINDDCSLITESVYGDGSTLTEKYTTSISGNTITEKEVAL